MMRRLMGLVGTDGTDRAHKDLRAGVPKCGVGRVEALEGRALLSMVPWATPPTGGSTAFAWGDDSPPVGSDLIVERPDTKIAPAFASTDGPVLAAAAGFQIDVVFPDSSLTATQQAAFAAAAARWEQIITGDIPDVAASPSRWGAAVDDVRITATGADLGGPGGVLGSAGPEYLRNGTSLPITGSMEFDTADLPGLEANGSLGSVILHEMGHVLGFGTIWTNKGLLTGAGGSNPRYTGASATAEFNTIFTADSTSIPLEATGGAGTRDSHWRDSTFLNELMTGYISSGSNPLSRITAAQFIDLGYPGVVLSAADSYTPANIRPVVTSLSDSSDPVVAANNFTLTANGVSDPGGAVDSVSFFRESNGTSGLQATGSNADTLISTDNSNTGGYTATVTTTGLAPGTYTYYARAVDFYESVSLVASTTNTIIAATSAIPGVPDLVTASDTGTSSTDDLTSRDNSAAGKTLQFSVVGTFTGATVTLFADGSAIGSALATGATVTVTTNGTTDLADGTHSFTARQTEAGKLQSADSSGLTVRVDTAAPTADVTDVTPDPRTTPVASAAVVFSESVANVGVADLALTRDGGANLLAGSAATVNSSNGGSTWTFGGLSGLTSASGTYSLTLAGGTGTGITDAAGNALAAGASDTFTVIPLPAVQSVTVNDGSDPQRSKVNSLTVTFNQPVTLDAGAFALAGRDGAGAGTVLTVLPASGASQTFNLTFGGTSIVGGSLSDGVYDLTVAASKVHAAAVPAAAMAADYAFAFHRLFSDADGDGDSDNADLFAMRATYGRNSTDDPSLYKPYFDYEADGDVDNADVFQVRARREVEFKNY